MLVYKLHWSSHPAKDEAWYNEQKKRMTRSELGREIDISYEFSVEGVVFGNFLPSHVIKEYHFDPDKALYRSLDFGRTNACLFAQRDSMERWVIFKEVILSPSDTPSQCQVVRAMTLKYQSRRGTYDTCDPAGGTAEWKSGQNVTDIKTCQEHGIFPQVERIRQIRDREKEGIKLIEKTLHERVDGTEMVRIVESECPTLCDAFRSGYRYKQDVNGRILDQVAQEHPYEDIMDCLRYLLIQFAPAIEQKPMPHIGIQQFRPNRNPYFGGGRPFGKIGIQTGVGYNGGRR